MCFLPNPSAPTFSIVDVPLKFVNCAKIIGIWLHDDLKWDKQITEMLKKANSRLYMLRYLERFGFNPTKLGIIYKGYVTPLLEYGDVVWGSSLTCDQGTTLEKVQETALTY